MATRTQRQTRARRSLFVTFCVSASVAKKVEMVNINIEILSVPLDIAECVNWVMTPESGGIDVFIGTVRNATKGKEVIRLEFEAYEKMAKKQMEKIAREIMEKWPVNKMLIHHRAGSLEVGEIPVII